MLQNENIAYKATLIYTFNHSMVYQLGLQTETTFTFLSVLGMLIMYYRVDPNNLTNTLRSKNIIAAAFVFGLNVLCRAQGLLFLGFQGQIMVKKILDKSDRFCKIFKYVFYSVWIIIIYLLSYSMVTYWKPYVMHCETKLDRTDAVPSWCFEKIPNIFSYI